ncbi:MAG: hypothetical protein U9R19_03905, partial [Bacteroidota bacterium]|nr:hypothetical protein [Bacteroidota bacterium]
MKDIKVLIVEDAHDDAELIILELSRQGINADWKRVETCDSIISELKDRQWDIIISDFSLPGLTGF